MSFNIYTAHKFTGADRSVLLVKDGFCWSAAIFGPLWALSHLMWWAALLLFVVWAGLDLALLAAGANLAVSLAASFGLAACIGYGANDWRRESLRRRGARRSGLVAARGADAALRRFLDLTSVKTAATGAHL